MINLIRVATMMKEQEAQSVKREELWKIEQEKQREREKLQKMENDRIETLIKEADRLVKFKQIRDYIEVITTVGKERLEAAYPGSDFSKWVEWAEKVLEGNDPKSWDLPKYDISDKYRYY